MAIPSDHDGDAFYLSDVSPKDKPWDVHKAQAQAVAALYAQSDYFERYGSAFFQRYAERMEDCARNLVFAFETNDQAEISLRLQAAKFCRIRHCPTCQWRRCLKWLARFFDGLPQLLGDYPDARFIFLTLTVKNCDITELRDTLAQMNAAWKRMIQRKSWPAEGFVRSTEVTRGKDGTAHPHFHCLLMVPASYFEVKKQGNNYLSQAEWSELWQQCLKINYTPIVNVKAIKARTSETHPEMMKGICETLKYSIKPDDLIADADWLYEVTGQLRKTRAVALGGTFKQYFAESEPEDLIHINGEDEEDEAAGKSPVVQFDWRDQAKRYRKK